MLLYCKISGKPEKRRTYLDTFIVVYFRKVHTWFDPEIASRSTETYFVASVIFSFKVHVMVREKWKLKKQPSSRVRFDL